MAPHRDRPDPDELLASLRPEEASLSRGRLKIVLGYAAGVGKTFAMLEAAHQRLTEGVDVVVGVVETHGRAETEALVAGLEDVPCRRTDYRGVQLREMDLDGILSRKPGLVLVDELAHTNAPGGRHPKRYQDVLEILDAGIDVYTTLNVQHIESLNDVVAQITGVTVRETVPDRVIDEADSIEVVDLPPAELLQRLSEGKVYVPDQARRALRMFFREGNLTALREIALRRTASRLDEQMRRYMTSRSILGPWPATDRLLVCVSASPLSERLVRATRRLADGLSAEWYAVHVETPDRLASPQGKRDRVASAMHLAEELGARTVILPGGDVPGTVIDFARHHNVTKIVVGTALGPRWLDRLRGSVVDALIYESGDIDVYVISGRREPAPRPGPAAAGGSRPGAAAARQYAAGLVLVAAATVISYPVHLVVSPANLVLFYLAAVVAAALFLGRGPALVAAAAGVLALDFFFVDPRLRFSVDDTEYLLTFLALFVVGVVVSSLASQVRDQALSAQRREVHARTLYEFSRDLAAAAGVDDILAVIVRHLREAFDRGAVVLMPVAGELAVVARSPEVNLTGDELAVADWAFRRNSPTGRGTDTLPAAALSFLPLATRRGVVGVLGVGSSESSTYPAADTRRLLETFASLAALAVERAVLAGEPDPPPRAEDADRAPASVRSPGRGTR